MGLGLGVQGKAEELEAWQNLYLNKHFDKSRNDTSLVLLSFDKPMSGTPPDGVKHIFVSGTTWSSGRNALGRALYETERKQGNLMRYWMFADADMVAVSCKSAEASGMAGVDAAAYCLDRHVQYYLLGKLQYASVFFLGALGTEQEHYNFDCGDAQMHAIHRAAAQVLLPYVEMLEDLSWQESQSVLWRVASGCIADGGIGAGILSMRPEDKKHSTYPGGSFLTARSHAINVVYGKKYSLSPHPIDNSTFNTVQGDCAHQPNQLAELKSRNAEAPTLTVGHRVPGGGGVGGHGGRRLEQQQQQQQQESSVTVTALPLAPIEDVQRSMLWKQTLVFRHCHHRLASRFDQFMSGAPLDLLDGPRLEIAHWPKETN